MHVLTGSKMKRSGSIWCSIHYCSETQSRNNELEMKKYYQSNNWVKVNKIITCMFGYLFAKTTVDREIFAVKIFSLLAIMTKIRHAKI